jgi:hypothetical protein
MKPDYKIYNLSYVSIDNGFIDHKSKPLGSKEKFGTFDIKTTSKVNTTNVTILSKSKSGKKDISHILSNNWSESNLSSIIAYRQVKVEALQSIS